VCTAQVRDATHHLLLKVIPAFADALVRRVLVPITRRQLLDMLHAAGINARERCGCDCDCVVEHVL
jgi:hypothetical protein